mmetsp:Transcript_17990/g.13017  ORF Transcript_17990/g.13017 Transcript_17990/m.13017 type:complete len:109 (+) Transcript_17990:773-1099(+)
MYYYVLFLNEKYFWLFENCELRQFNLKSTFTFALENLTIEGQPPDRKAFKVELAPGQHQIETMVRKNSQAEAKYKCSYSLTVEGWLEYMEALQKEANEEGELAREENV